MVLATTACCVNSCRNSHTDKLRFVGAGQSSPPKSHALFLVVVVHGWIEKGRGDWPEDMANAIQKNVNTELWLCGYFDWAKGAVSLNPTDAATYAADIAG